MRGVERRRPMLSWPLSPRPPLSLVLTPQGGGWGGGDREGSGHYRLSPSRSPLPLLLSGMRTLADGDNVDSRSSERKGERRRRPEPSWPPPPRPPPLILALTPSIVATLVVGQSPHERW